MRNISAIIVGVIIAAGAGVAIWHAVDGNSPSTATNEAVAAPPPPTTVADNNAVPKPAGSFGKVPVGADEYVMGKADAPITLIEYASLTCPHCAHFNEKVFPTIKKEFIDKGIVRFVYRDFPLDNLALTASVIARCAGHQRYFGFIDAFFASQRTWALDKDPVSAMSRIARLGGMTQQDVSACLKKKEITDAVLKERLEADQKYGVHSTPTILLNGDKYPGALTIEQFRTAVKQKLK